MLRTLMLSLLFVSFPLLGAYAEDEESGKKKYRERFDAEVREDLFAGFSGDEKALAKGMGRCEEVLKEDPDHAEALVWLGAARVFLSGESFSKGNVVKGAQLWAAGLKDMDRAVELEPDNVGVLIPRAAVLMPAGRNAPPAMGKPVIERVRKDLERTYARQKNSLDKLGEHPLGELRMGLADVYRFVGEFEKSEKHLNAILEELPDSDYAERAARWLKAKPTEKLAHSCIGCHTE